MSDKRISVKDLSDRHGLNRPTVFKVINRLGIEPEKTRGGSESRGQMISYITENEANQVLETIAAGKSSSNQNDGAVTEAALYDVGVFYLIQLEPEHDPSRFKVGFASNLNERLRQHRCSAPFAEVLKTWPCRRLWEKTAIECVTDSCKQLHTEVFRAESIENVENKCEQFFELMPKLNYE